MSRVHCRLFWLVLGLGSIAGLWSHTWYSATDAAFSDLPQYGISHGSDAYADIVAIKQSQIRTTTLPIVGVAIAALAGWGYLLLRLPENRDESRLRL